MKKLNLVLIGITILIASCWAGMYGCAKDVGDSGVENIAITLNIAMSTFVDEGLRELEKYDPAYVDEVLIDLQLVSDQITGYLDGEGDVSDFVNSLSAIINRVNERVELVAPESSSRMLRVIANASKILNQYFESVDLPDEVTVYAAAVQMGINEGIQSYVSSLQIPFFNTTGGTE